MPSSFLSSDLATFFDTDEFASSATKQGGTTAAVIFDRPSLAQLGIVSGSRPQALAKASDFSDSDVGNTLTIAGVAYTIRDVQRQDDELVVLLELSVNV